MKLIQGYQLITPDELHWRPSNLMRIPNADCPATPAVAAKFGDSGREKRGREPVLPAVGDWFVESLGLKRCFLIHFPAIHQADHVCSILRLQV